MGFIIDSYYKFHVIFYGVNDMLMMKYTRLKRRFEYLSDDYPGKRCKTQLRHSLSRHPTPKFTLDIGLPMTILSFLKMINNIS